jgi:hypothetical protein
MQGNKRRRRPGSYLFRWRCIMSKNIFLCVFMILLFGTFFWAQNNSCPCLNGQLLNQNEIIRLEGRVDWSSFVPGAGSPVLTLVLSNGEKALVQIAPFWYLRNMEFPFKSGENISISAFKLSWGQSVRTVALSIRSSDGKELKLRDEYGCPLWSAGRRMGWNRQLNPPPANGIGTWGQGACGMGRGRGQCWRVTAP